MIYLLEDDPSIRELVVYSLSSMGMEAEGFELPSAFLGAVRLAPPELILLDIMLPEEDGFSVLRKLRAAPVTQNIPVIMLTAKSTEFDTVTALDSGADDYISKPFGVMELVARVKAVLRRANGTRAASAPEAMLCEGGLCVCPDKHTVTVNGESVTLTYKEFELLLLLLRNKGVVLTRDRILSSVWGYAFDGENRTVDVHVRSLRSKLLACGELIETVRGVGYKLGK